MTKHLKRNLIIYGIFAGLYLLFNYIPFSYLIANEYAYLGFKMGFYVILSTALIIVKHKYHIEIEVPEKQISVLWLLPLMIICFAHPLYAILFNEETYEEIEVGILLFDSASDIFVSIAEDVIFVDLYISILLEITKKYKYKRVTCVLLAAITFTILHCYTFIYRDVFESLVILVTVFFLIMECGYAAIYFDSAVIPVVLHAAFNEINFVIFEQVYHLQDRNWKYALFLLLILTLTSCYLAAIHRMSTLQKYKPDFHQDEVE